MKETTTAENRTKPWVARLNPVTSLGPFGGNPRTPFGQNQSTSGNLAIRVTADKAARMLADLAKDLEFVDLTSAEVLKAFEPTRRRGGRGGRVHDFLPAIAAEKSGTEQLLTTDENDIESLLDYLRVAQV